MKANLRHAAGSLLVVGLAGTELTDAERAWLKLLRPAGVILFRRNIETPKQTRNLLKEATNLCMARSFRCVDVEGGTVDRLRDALAPIPSAQAVMQAATHTRKTKLIREQAELIAQSVKAFGFNTTLAPVLDLALPATAKVMGTRAAASTPPGVTEYARNFLAGLAKHGVVGCGKHFPGLGSGTLDSHLHTPSIDRTMRQLTSNDLVPYRELRRKLPMIMVSHAAYPQTPGGDRPASASPYWITTVLRKRIGYRGLIFSDDLEMGGILNFMSIGDAAVASIRAGMDLIEICHSPDLILQAHESLLVEAERSAAFRKLLQLRSAQTAKHRARLFGGKITPPLSASQFKALRNKISRFSQTINSSQPNPQETYPA